MLDESGGSGLCNAMIDPFLIIVTLCIGFQFGISNAGETQTKENLRRFREIVVG